MTQEIKRKLTRQKLIDKGYELNQHVWLSCSKHRSHNKRSWIN